MSDFVSFNEFVDRTASAKFEHYRDTIGMGLRSPGAAASAHQAFAEAVAVQAPVDDEAIEAEFSQMKEFVLSLYQSVTDVKTQHTFVGTGGNFIDCVPFDQQPTARAAKETGHRVLSEAPTATKVAEDIQGPARVGAMAAPVLPPLELGLLDVYGKPMVCPQGRVPLRRITISQMARLGRFENFFRKYPAPLAMASNLPGHVPQPPPFAGTLGSTEIHRHAICMASGSNYFGCSTWLNLWQVDSAPGVFNLSQLWMLGSAPANHMQTIESGWQTYPNLWGTNAPALFVFYNPDNYNPATSGYLMNMNMHGFIQINSGWVIGAAIPQPYSSPGLAQYGIQMLWQIDNQRNWWLYLGGGNQPPTALGYFPAGLYQNGTLDHSAQVIEFGGEVCSQPPATPSYPSTGRMGSGVPPLGVLLSDFGQVAFQKDIYAQVVQGGPLVTVPLAVPSINPLDANYSAVAGSDPSFMNYLFFGGPNG